MKNFKKIITSILLTSTMCGSLGVQTVAQDVEVLETAPAEEEIIIEEPEVIEYKKANFFLQKYNQIQKEDGTTIAYPEDNYYPDKANHDLIQMEVNDIAAFEDNEVIVINKKLQNNEALTKEEVKELENDFKIIEKHLTKGYPVLYRENKSELTEQDKALRSLVLANYNITEEDLDSGLYHVLWYVIKKGAAIGNDGCDYHVDGIIYHINGELPPSKEEEEEEPPKKEESPPKEEKKEVKEDEITINKSSIVEEKVKDTQIKFAAVAPKTGDSGVKNIATALVIILVICLLYIIVEGIKRKKK